MQYVSPITTYIQIADTDPSVTFTGQLSDVSQVEKFELSEEAYTQRNGNSTLAYLTPFSQAFSCRHGPRIQTTSKTRTFRGEAR
jgi:hypothetical protein